MIPGIYSDHKGIIIKKQSFNLRLHRDVVAFGCVPDLPGPQTSEDLLPQQPLLLRYLLQDAFVLRRSPRQVRQHFVHGTVRHVFISRITRLTC